MGAHRVYLPLAETEGDAPSTCSGGPSEGRVVRILGDEAHHAVRVKRLAVGEPVELLDGAGGILGAVFRGAERLGKKSGWAIDLEIVSARTEERVRPRIEVCCPPPKGPRLESMIDQLSQCGAAAWRPLAAKRSVTEPRDGKMRRLDRVAGEAAKQSGRAWPLEILGPIAFERAVARSPDTEIVVADASGEPHRPGADVDSVRLVVGPEGGFTRGELVRARDAGATVARFGPHVMRVETAAVAAVNVIMDRAGGPPVHPIEGASGAREEASS